MFLWVSIRRSGGILPVRGRRDGPRGVTWAATGPLDHLKGKETQMNKDLFALWPIVPFGGEDGDGGDGGNGDGTEGNTAGEGNQGGNSNQGNQGKSSNGKSSGGKEKEDDAEDEYAGLSADELKRLLADKTSSEAKTKKDLKTLQDKEEAEQRKKNDDVTNLTKDLDKERETVATLRATMAKQAIINAIRDDTRYEWNNVEIVAGLLDPEVVKVTDEGKVEGIKNQLTKIAKDHDFLLKSQQQNGNQQQGNGSGGSGPTGFQPGQGGASNGGSEQDRKKLAEEYPALMSRI